MNNYSSKDHTFVVCAYMESEFLEECIQSLLKQTVTPNICIATSTPNPPVINLAEKYNLPLYINHGEKGIAGDWNFALSCAETDLVTLAHQDDTYEPRYLEVLLNTINRSRVKPILFCCAYSELREGEKSSDSSLIRIKRLLSFPMRVAPSSRFARRLSLSFGNSICCPSVTYVSDLIRKYPFTAGLKSNLDWEQWEKLSKLSGCFVYSKELLMNHRIHEDSESSKIIRETSRAEEDYEMFRKFWCKPIARALTKVYSMSEISYQTNHDRTK